jgi:hypothetical protein
LRKQAGEYVGEDTGDVSPDEIDPERQELGMRPAFSRKDLEQRRALDQLWDGFPTEDALRDWLLDIAQPTNGALEEEFVRSVTRDRVALRHLVRGRADPRRAQWYRELLAVQRLLPAFDTGIRRMDTGELAKRTRGGLEPTQA